MLDTEKLFKTIANDPELIDIPLAYISRIVIQFLRILNDGSCFTKEE